MRTLLTRQTAKRSDDRLSVIVSLQQHRKPYWGCISPMSDPEPPISDHFTGSKEPTFIAGRFPRRLFTIWGGKVFMGFVIAAGPMLLIRLASHVTRQAQEVEPANRPGSGVIVHTDVIGLWLPQTLIDLAKHLSPFPAPRTHQELQRFLERQNQKNLWYAVTIRGRQVSGALVDITLIRLPYNDPDHFPELLDILAAIAGNPPRDTTADFSTASVHILAGDSLKGEPREIIAEFLHDASQPVAEKRSPAPSEPAKPSCPASE
jgi:hypothetical protein